jgi:hypothetical protein
MSDPKDEVAILLGFESLADFEARYARIDANLAECIKIGDEIRAILSA